MTRIRFRIILVAAILTIVFFMSTITVVMILSEATDTSWETAQNLFVSAVESSQAKLESVLGEAAALVNTAAAVEQLAIPPEDDGLAHPTFRFLEHGLQAFPRLYSVYVGYADGRFFQMIDAAGDDKVLAAHGAPVGTRFIVRTITGTPDRYERWSFLDASQTVIGTSTVSEPPYDPRDRPWYYGANRTYATFSQPYVFASLGEPGITASRKLAENGGVFGADITLEALQRFVDEYAGIPDGGMLIMDTEGRILAASGAVLEPLAIPEPLLPLSAAPDTVRNLPEGVHRVAGRGWLTIRREWSGFNGRDWTIVAAVPESAFSGPFDRLQQRVLIAATLVLILAIPVVLRTSVSMTHVLGGLAADAERIGRLEFVPTPQSKSRITEFYQLSSGFTTMKRELSIRTEALHTSLSQLEKLIDLTIAISAEHNIDHLCELILDGARELSHADGGSLYLVTEERDALEFQIVLNESLESVQGGTSGYPVTMPPVPLFDEHGEPNHNNVVSSCFHSEQTVNIEDAYNATGFDFSGTRVFDEANGYRSTSFLTVPLKPRGARIIGAMQLINSTNPETRDIQPFTPEIQRFVEALASGAATALYNRDLIEIQKNLFDAMIQLVAGAIDAKSPYTSGHCERVPEIAMMLAEEAERATTGSLEGFSLGDEQEWRAFRLGAWLHDAGKVTTPEYVVDKATKLETMYDRIHEVRTRFEVLLRDARVDMHRAIEAGTPREEAEARFREAALSLQEDFAFIAERNLGTESLSPEHEERIRTIAERRWLRHFDDRLGLSWVELERYPTRAEEESQEGRRRADVDHPIEERLLADKPQHRIPRVSRLAQLYDRYNFTLDYPLDLYNRGEIYNLTIGRGTLTNEERFKINEHVIQTIVMLDRLPLPPELKRVTEYAGTHHEALNGRGYPRGLTAADLSIPARIMAIADIFEALTASDRPYKRARPLSVAIEILYQYKLDRHIDGELFDIFLTSGAYRRYAERHLKPEQLDEVDITKYLG